jgi:hypothetical protein
MSTKIKNKIIFASIFLLSASLLSGCGSSNNDQKNAEVSREPDFEQPERQPDVMGIVKSVTGNEVTILKLDISKLGERGGSGEEEATGDTEKITPSLSSGGMGGMGGGMGRSRDTSVSDEDRIEMMKSRTVGEMTILIPVGIQMLTPGSDEINESERSIAEATFDEIKQDKMVNIWLNKDVTDRNVAEFVFIKR